MTFVRIALIVAVALGVLAVGVWVYFERVANPRVVRELIEDPDGERAGIIMLLTLPSGRHIPRATLPRPPSGKVAKSRS